MASFHVEIIETSRFIISLCNAKPVIVGIVSGIHDLLAFELFDARTLPQGLSLKKGDAGAKSLELGGIDRHEGTSRDAEQE